MTSQGRNAAHTAYAFALARETTDNAKTQKRNDSFIHQSILMMRLKRPAQGEKMKHRKAKRRAAGHAEKPTFRFLDDPPQVAMLPLRRVERKNRPYPVLWLPEEATASYARQVHLHAGLDVALGDRAYYHNGRRQTGRSKYYWSVIDDAIATIPLETMTCQIRLCPA